MSESVLKRLWQEAREEVEIKDKAFNMEQIEKKKAKHVQLIKVFYVEPVASCTPTTKEIKKKLSKNR